MKLLKRNRWCTLGAFIILSVLFSCESTPDVPAEIPQPETAEPTAEIPLPDILAPEEVPETDGEPAFTADGHVSDPAVIAEPELVLNTEPEDISVPVFAEEPGNGVQSAAGVPAQSASQDIAAPEVPPPDTDAGVTSAEPLPQAADIAAEPSADIPGIWEYEPESVPESGAFADGGIKEPSRTVTAFVGTLLEVRYPEKGWVFLGDVSHSDCVKYRTKQADNGDSLFLFMPSEPGTAQLSFFRFDVLKDEYEDDILEVIVIADETTDKRTYAPPYVPAALRKLEHDRSSADSLPVSRPAGTDPYTADSISDEPELELGGHSEEETAAEIPANLESMSAAELLKMAEDACAAKQAKTVLDVSLAYVSRYTDQLDYIWYLTGQAYEMPGDNRNIKKALECYETVLSAFPFSPYWKRADDRAGYIKRFYFTIR